jgi:carbonic anhydrase
MKDPTDNLRPSRAALLRGVAGALTASLLAEPEPAPAAEASSTAMSADAALSRLLSGNARYRQDAAIHCNRNYDRRAEVAAAQAPFAIVLGCADSRVPPEVVFDQRLGDLFVVRLAGNVADDNAVGSIEYAVEHFHPALVMVLGHEKCGAVSATLDALKTGTVVDGFIGTIVTAISPAVKRSRSERGDALRNAVAANVADVVKRLRTVSAVVANAERNGALRVVGASYDLANGHVMLL